MSNYDEREYRRFFPLERMVHLLPPPALPGSGSKGIISGFSPPLLQLNICFSEVLVNKKLKGNDRQVNFNHYEIKP